MCANKGYPLKEWVSEWKLLSCVWLFSAPWTLQSMESPGQNFGVGSLSLLQRMFPTPNRTGVSCIAGWFFTKRAMREAHPLKTYKKKTQLSETYKAFPFKSRLDMDLGPGEPTAKWKLVLGVPSHQAPGTPLATTPITPQEGAVQLPDTQNDPPHHTQTVQLQTTGLDRKLQNMY